MNQHLKILLNFIRQAKYLCVEKNKTNGTRNWFTALADLRYRERTYWRIEGGDERK